MESHHRGAVLYFAANDRARRDAHGREPDSCNRRIYRFGRGQIHGGCVTEIRRHGEHTKAR